MDLLLPPPPEHTVVASRKRSVGLVLVVSMIGGALAGYVGMQLGGALAANSLRPAVDAAPSAWVLAPLVLLSLFFVLLAHEVGHVLGGVSQGFRFMLLVVGPLQLARDEQTQRLKLSRNRSLELAGGVAACIPTDDHELTRRMSVMVVAGPLVSLLLGAIALIAISVQPVAWWSVIIGFVGVSSLMIGVVTAIPMNNGSFVSDGKRFLQLRADGPSARRDIALLTYSLQDQRGEPVASLPAARVRDALEPADGSMQELMSRSIAYTWLVTQGRPAEAQSHLQRAAALSIGKPFNFEATVAMELAFAAAWFDADIARARSLVGAHTKVWRLLPEAERLRAEAAIALVSGDLATARSQIERARGLLSARGAKRSGAAQWSLDRLAEMEQRLSV